MSNVKYTLDFSTETFTLNSNYHTNLLISNLSVKKKDKNVKTNNNMSDMKSVRTSIYVDKCKYYPSYMFGFFKYGDEVTSCFLCVYFVHCLAHFQHESVTNAKITTTSVSYRTT